VCNRCFEREYVWRKVIINFSHSEHWTEKVAEIRKTRRSEATGLLGKTYLDQLSRNDSE
jgi:hypothetical protein